MMAFNENDVNRDADGQFGAKTGAQPEVGLADEAPTTFAGVDEMWRTEHDAATGFLGQFHALDRAAAASQRLREAGVEPTPSNSEKTGGFARASTVAELRYEYEGATEPENISHDGELPISAQRAKLRRIQSQFKARATELKAAGFDTSRAFED